jgi:hypothetical protein
MEPLDFFCGTDRDVENIYGIVYGTAVTAV